MDACPFVAASPSPLQWSADKCIQQLGRTHRSNEVHGVLYSLVTSNLGGERRFSSACAARLQSLGALTKGDRRAATGSNLAQFDFDTPYGKKALRTMVDRIRKSETALNDEALAALQGIGHSVLPEPEVKLKHDEIAAELAANPPDRDELAPYSAFIPHPAPWSLHNCLMLNECLESMGMGAGVDLAKLQVKVFLNRILGLLVGKQNMRTEGARGGRDREGSREGSRRGHCAAAPSGGNTALRHRAEGTLHCAAERSTRALEQRDRRARCDDISLTRERCRALSDSLSYSYSYILSISLCACVFYSTHTLALTR
jgi:hypothetical protein